ncbi:hypothetical protein LTS18_003174 [Coniosporium uncinatum]|uniref:Uncharacterized protein n=1 Tax=Coniosporium uncinatum TaxID=93489 RepID=A0ACC3D704_9PEZI|nr:hypothetical protein LTS18_003174 [Coniosporium uncinatum]
MPRVYVPKKLGLHREASIALYRALLTQTSLLPPTAAAAAAAAAASTTSPEPPTDARPALTNLIRNRYRANRHLVSPRLNKLAFLAGYAALDTLDAAVAGDAAATARLLDIAGRAPRSLTAESPTAKQARARRLVVDAKKQADAARKFPPREDALLGSRPRPARDVKGRRHIPHMVNANGVPFLRFKRPQPENLTRLLRSKMESKFKRVEREQELEGYWVPLAEGEDGWDEVLKRCCGPLPATRWKQGEGEGEAARETKWVDVYKQALWDVRRAVKETERGNRELARKMTDLVGREQVLADKERWDRVVVKEKRRAERRAAWLARESADADGHREDALSHVAKLTS